MKFQCERCKTRYSIADEKVRGKILKIRCKSCEAVITVRDGGDGSVPKLEPELAPRPVVTTAGGKGRIKPAAKTIEIAAMTSSGSIAAQPEPPPDLDARSSAEEWYLSVDGKQEGPFSPEEAQRRVARKVPGVEMFAWRDDFTDWLPVEEVPVLAVHVPKRLPPPPPRRTTGPVGIGTGSQGALPGTSSPALVSKGAATRRVSGPVAAQALALSSSSASAPALARAPMSQAAQDPASEPLFPRDRLAGDATAIDDPFDAAAAGSPELTPPPPPDGFDFQIGEASRVVKLPILPPAPAGVTGPKPGGKAGASGLPGVASSHSRQDPSLKIAIADLSHSALAVQSADQKPVSPSRHRRLMGPLILGGVAFAGVLGAVVILSRSGDDGAKASGDEVTDNLLVNDFYRKDNPLLGHDEKRVEAPAPGAPAAPPDKSVKPPPAKTVASVAPSRPRAVDGAPRLEPVGRPDPPRIGPVPGKSSGKVDTFDDEGGPSEALTPDDVRNTYAANEVGLKRCYERSLKSDPTTNITKMIVKITISPHGNISEISVPDKTDLGNCVSNSIRSWRFRRSNGEFTTEFTVFFAKRG